MGIRVGELNKNRLRLARWKFGKKSFTFLEEEAKAADPAQKFSLRKSIEEAKTKIRDHGGQA
jgi:hypothetical protein